MDIQKKIVELTQAQKVDGHKHLQKLWSGYGSIRRYTLSGFRAPSVIVKHICLPKQNNHPRGWNTNRSHQRKIKSYEIESYWYAHWAKHCNRACKVPQLLGQAHSDNETLLVLEDLDAAGFPKRLVDVDLHALEACLRWLANFHATFLHKKPAGLWPIGTYWHLATRPDELAALADKPLKKAATAIDEKLKNSIYQTIVHGDAKLANFCFSEDERQVAAVDFQYVGGGCGMKDVAYFIGSCLREDDCERLEAPLLELYFSALRQAVSARNLQLDFAALEKDWRALYPVAWTDFHRFLKGWSPDHWKINSYSERLAQQVVANLYN